MIVVAIVGILAAIAYPSYQDYVKSTRRGDAQGALMSFANAMERYHTQNGSYWGADGQSPGADYNYTGALKAPPAALFPSEAPLDGNAKFYDLGFVDLKRNSFTLRAVPKGGQAGDGFVQLSSTGARAWDRNNNNSVDAGETTWSK